MEPDIIKDIASKALASIDSILSQWLPNGKASGREYKARNPTRNDKRPGSFSINLNTGNWQDFATKDKGLDLVSLVAYLDGVTQSEAAEKVAVFLGIPLEKGLSDRGSKRTKSGGNGEPSPEKETAQNQHSASDSSNDGWACVMPVPNHAPPAPVAHRRHGKPDCRYSYCGMDGQLNFYHDRYEPKSQDARKEFSPLTLWRKGDSMEWRFKVPPALRPLYGLPSLIKHPDAWAWFVEGEKAARALEKLLPDHPVLTWQGGSHAVAKADFQPLQGRKVRIWPDYDEPGARAACDLIQKLEEVGAADIEVLNLERLALYAPAFVDTGNGAVAKLDRTGTAHIKSGDDAHDLFNRNKWTADHFGQFLEAAPDSFIVCRDYLRQSSNDKPKSKTTSKSITKSGADSKFTGSFSADDHGVFFLRSTRDGEITRQKICDKLEVIAETRNEDGKQWGILVKFRDRDGKDQTINLPSRAFNGEGLEVTGRLLEDGLRIEHKARPLVLQYLSEQRQPNRARVTEKTGWHGSGKGLTYVLPDCAISGPDQSEQWVFSNQNQENHFKTQGSLEDWKKSVSSLCVGNSRLVFSVSAAFAAPLLNVLGMENGGFHWRGPSSSGKSTILQAAASACGSRQYVRRWRTTDNGMEGVAQSHSDALLILDELKEIDPKVAGETIYMLANGGGKNRANSNTSLRTVPKWRLLYLSSGELSLTDHIASAGKDTHTGMELRLCDLPVDAGQGLGAFEYLHNHENGSEFSKAVNESTQKYYGTAFVQLIEKALNSQDRIIKDWRDFRPEFEKQMLTASDSGQARRVVSRFALVAYAGTLATDWGITGWAKDEAIKASGKCFREWLENFGRGDREQLNIISHLRLYLEQHGDSRFMDVDRINDSHAPRTPNALGFRGAQEDGIHYYIFSETFKKTVFSGFDYKAAARLLISKEYMQPGEGKHLAPKITLPGAKGKRQRLFHVYPRFMEGDDE